MVQITGPDGQYLGYAARVLDLSNPDEPWPGAVSGPPPGIAWVAVGHVRADDPSGPVVIFGEDHYVLDLPEPLVALMRPVCPHCTVSAAISPAGPRLFFAVLTHQGTCAWLNRMVALAGRPPVAD